MSKDDRQAKVNELAQNMYSQAGGDWERACQLLADQYIALSDAGKEHAPTVNQGIPPGQGGGETAH